MTNSIIEYISSFSYVVANPYFVQSICKMEYKIVSSPFCAFSFSHSSKIVYTLW